METRSLCNGQCLPSQVQIYGALTSFSITMPSGCHTGDQQKTSFKINLWKKEVCVPVCVCVPLCVCLCVCVCCPIVYANLRITEVHADSVFIVGLWSKVTSCFSDCVCVCVFSLLWFCCYWCIWWAWKSLTRVWLVCSAHHFRVSGFWLSFF